MAITEPQTARGFGPGLPPQGATVKVAPAGEQLLIEDWPQVQAVARNKLLVRRQGEGLALEWQTAGGRCALALDAQAAGMLSGWLPQTAASAQDKATRRWLGVALFLAIGLPLLLLALFFAFRTTLVDIAVGQIDVAQEKDLADQLWQMQRMQLKLIEQTAANRFVEEVGARLTAVRPSPYRYQFFIADEASVNAFAMPAGYIVVHRGLLQQAASAEEVAGVLAHEIEHVEQRHALRGLVQELGMTLVTVAVSGDLGGVAAHWMQDLAGLQFSRSQESAADEGGYARLLAARIDPHGMASFFEKLGKEQAGMPGALSLLSTHPDSAERAQAIQARLQAAPGLPPLKYDWAAIRDSLPAGQ